MPTYVDTYGRNARRQLELYEMPQMQRGEPEWLAFLLPALTLGHYAKDQAV